MELFEKVIGRKPSPEEFQAGKESGFDFKQIKTIAGGLVDSEKVVEEKIKVTIPEETDSGLVSKQWAEDFERTYGRKPSPEEFLQAKVQGFVLEDSMGKLESTTPMSSTEILVSSSDSDKAHKKTKKLSKKKLIFSILFVLLALSLGATYFYFQRTTGIEVTAKEFVAEVDKKDYRQVAERLSTDTDKWTKEDAKLFVSHLEEQGIDVKVALDQVLESATQEPVKDQAGNLLLGLEKTGKLFGIFSQYRVVAYPIQVQVETNLNEAKLTTANNKVVALKKDAKTDLGAFHFINRELTLEAKTDVGTVSTKLQIDPRQAQNNQLLLKLNSEKENWKSNFQNKW
ncbi:TcaA second domain-containing protein [Streptococcus sp. DD10]|uniref:TcaA second domain-containing protein n=1 Tax=Streptococcus sp. DD10 TaxID=1777878 RepID=UPI001E53A66C|nr:hypothetical protein [Streptococcus sp. DD10]